MSGFSDRPDEENGRETFSEPSLRKIQPKGAARLNAAWEVRAGLVPGQAMPEYTKQFFYTDADYEEDGKHASEFAYQPIFMQRMVQASNYHQQMSNPQTLNWAELTFIWY